MDPVQAKVGKTIEDVAKENGFSLILNLQISGLDVILYGDDKLDVSDLVLKKMGITPPPPATLKNNNDLLIDMNPVLKRRGFLFYLDYGFTSSTSAGRYNFHCCPRKKA